MVSDRLKKFIFKQLDKELLKVEIIPYKGSIFFIDRENKYWYFEYEKSGTLWWRYSFFENFFVLFSLESHECEEVMSEWVEEVLNCKVNTTYGAFTGKKIKVEEVLNCKVNTTNVTEVSSTEMVEEVLNCKVNTTFKKSGLLLMMVEEVLNCKVNTTLMGTGMAIQLVEEVLNFKVSATQRLERLHPRLMEEVLEEVLNEKK